MGRQLNLRQHYIFLLEPVHAPSGQLLAWELLTRFTHSNEVASPLYTGTEHELFSCMLVPEKWQLFLLQLEQIDTLFASGFAQTIALNVDRDIIDGVLHHPAIQQRLAQWPLLRLEVSACFTERYLPSDSALLQNLVARLSAPLWLDDFGAGSSTLSMLDSNVFEYVKTDRRFFWKYGESHAFDLMLNHLNELSNGVIVQGVDTQKHREWLAGKPLAGLQGRQWRMKQIADFDEFNKGSKAAGTLKKRNNKNISNVIFL